MTLVSFEKINYPNVPLIVLVGPTAIGKTELSLQLAEEFDAEIIGVDSMQIYKFMDVGTAKPTVEERARVPHHLIDFVDPAEEYNVARFVEDAGEAVSSILNNNRLPLMAGGTGLYFKGFLEGLFDLPKIKAGVREELVREFEEKGCEVLYKELLECDPVSAQRIHRNDQARLVRALEIYRGTGVSWSDLLAQQQIRKQESARSRIKPLKIGLKRDRDDLYARINKRVGLMVEQGLLNEVEKLLSMGYSGSLHSMQSLGYRHMVNYLEGKWSWEESLELLARDTRRYAKRQLTWFRKDHEIDWISPDSKSMVVSKVEQYLITKQQGNGVGF